MIQPNSLYFLVSGYKIYYLFNWISISLIKSKGKVLRQRFRPNKLQSSSVSISNTKLILP